MEPNSVQYRIIGGPRDGDDVQFEFGRVFDQIALMNDQGVNAVYKRKTIWVDAGTGSLTWRVYYVIDGMSREEFQSRAQGVEDAGRKTIS